jgi:hypothetical protein
MDLLCATNAATLAAPSQGNQRDSWSAPETPRRAKARTQDALYEAIATALEKITPEDSYDIWGHCFVGINS